MSSANSQNDPWDDFPPGGFHSSSGPVFKTGPDTKFIAQETSIRISFHTSTAGEPIMILDHEGMIYKGKRIEDAGEAHRAWLETMKLMQGVNR